VEGFVNANVIESGGDVEETENESGFEILIDGEVIDCGGEVTDCGNEEIGTGVFVVCQWEEE
jgi:hypothetical protein